MTDHDELLRAFPLLRSLASDQRGVIQLTPVVKQRGEAFFHQDSPADNVYGIASGHVSILRQSLNGREVCMEFLGPGEMFAAVAVMKNIRMPAAAIAAEGTLAYAISAADFRVLLGRHPSLMSRVFEIVSQRLVNSVDARLSLAADPVDVRVAQALLRLAAKYAEAAGDKLVFGTAITRQQLADIAGTTVETAIRVMSRFTRDGLVRSSASRITIADARALEQLAQGTPLSRAHAS